MEKSICTMFEELPKIVKILLVIFLGGLIGGIYRILKYVESKNIVGVNLIVIIGICECKGHNACVNKVSTVNSCE